jgi:hypothetical protein
MHLSAYLNTLKAQYIVGRHCMCGLVPKYRGHDCHQGRGPVVDLCPACLKLVLVQCPCDTICPFCAACCELLEAPVLAGIS